MTSLTKDAVAPLGVKPRDAERSKNFFALGLVSWMYTRPTEPTLQWIDEKFAAKPQVAAANRAAFAAGPRLRGDRRAVRPPVRGAARRASSPAPTPTSPATPPWRGAWWPPDSSPSCRSSSGATRSPRRRTSSTSCPSTRRSASAPCRPKTRSPGSAPRSALRSAGTSAVTTTSGPGIALKSETMGLAVSLELPLLIVDIQRGGPSTGLPTKTEQADLLQVLYGRHGESPIPVVAAYSPAQCFDAAIEAARIALAYRTPVVLLSDGYLANGSEPWRLPEVADLPDISVAFATEPNHTDSEGEPEFWPYLRDPDTLARPWAVPGTPGLEHRIGGIEKQDGTGNISYDPANHERMVHLRAEKVAGIARDIPPVEVLGDVEGAELLVVGWGSTWGAIDGAVNRCRGRAQGGAGAPDAPQPVPGEPRRRSFAGTRGWWCPSSTWASCRGCSAPSTWWTPARSPRCEASRSPPASSRRPS
jgi:2-oxoglutarate/2-oxoacid ferredoxin oxidoreductase subunit alpha